MRDCFWVTEDYCRLILSGGDSLKVNSYSNAATFEQFLPVKTGSSILQTWSMPESLFNRLIGALHKVVFLYL